LSIQDNQLIENNLSIFENLGFEIEKFGNNCWRILSVPILFKDRDIKKILIEMIEDLSVSDKIKDIDSYSEEMLNYLACRGAIKAGDKLTQEEMQRLLEKLKNTQLGYTCPHGRPAQIELTLKDLYKIFKRTK
jgi:DNA mismatch repair protein MutL